jgi:RimJ/RimL family protein N-acetyltransferase
MKPQPLRIRADVQVTCVKYEGVEAVRAALGWGAGQLAPNHRRVVAMIHPDNAASVTVAARCNFRHYAVARYKDEPTGLWEYRWQN